MGEMRSGVCESVVTVIYHCETAYLCAKLLIIYAEAINLPLRRPTNASISAVLLVYMSIKDQKGIFLSPTYPSMNTNPSKAHI